jgi:phage terminase large subunit GpA-like protein
MGGVVLFLCALYKPADKKRENTLRKKKYRKGSFYFLYAPPQISKQKRKTTLRSI